MYTQEQMEALPKGFTPSPEPNRSFKRKLKRGLLKLTELGIIKVFKPNCRKLTDGRKKHKQSYFGKI